ncbi:MAG: HDOD domain-containing protein [Pirellulales bacterium]|nr:HDOD domain-containing protein [Pirellulales bacterium]
MGVHATDPRNADNPHDRPSGELIEKLFSQIGEVSSLPDVAMHVIRLANDPDTETDDLLEAVRSDPALAMRLMRTVNSSYYMLAEKVSDLRQAITLLGFKEVCNLALTAYVARLFKEASGYGQYTRRGLWNHMVGVGMVARLLARTCGKVAPQEVYLAGLLHDLGLILIDQYLHRPFCRVVDVLDEDTPVCQVETRLLGFDHAALGEYVAVKWNLPPQLTAAIGHHHAPEKYDGPHRWVVDIVAVANCLCHLKNLTSLGVRQAQPPPARLFAELGLQKQQLTLIFEQLDEVLQTADGLAVAQVR